LHKNLFLKL